jgi:hypothetical protein
METVIALAYAPQAEWRNRTEFLHGREIREFLRRKWARELDYRLRKTLWGFHDNRWRSASSTSGTTTPVNGSAPTASSFGRSTATGSCDGEWPASMTPRSHARSGGS